ncbi:cutinase family protein [Corynebacterium sanguinis]|nr:cutinase family protein [Corynebacterium sanguinis]
MARTYITYPAAAGGAFIPGFSQTAPIPYDDSMIEGARNTAAVIQEINEKCPDTKIFLAGHSQGAQVVSTVAREVGAGTSTINPDIIAGVALFSDPTRAEGSPVLQSGAQRPAAVPGTDGAGVRQVGSFDTPARGELAGGGMGTDISGKSFGALAGRTASWCIPGDLVCDLPVSGPMAQLVSGTAQKLNLSDPEKSVQAVADTLGRAVQMGGVNDIQDGQISYGPGGFEAAAATVPQQRETLIGQIAMDGAKNVQPGLGEQFVSDLGESVIGSVSALGGMALGAGMTILKKTLTPSNIVQIAAAGIASPEAGIATAVTKLSSAALEVITPETAVGAAQAVLDEVDILGVTPENLAQTVSEIAGHGQAHNAYAVKAVTADGRTPMEASIEWAVAASGDISGNDVGLPEAKRPVSVSSFDPQLASSALAELSAYRNSVEGKTNE